MTNPVSGSDPAPIPSYLGPFVLSPPAAPVERHGRVDLYLPSTSTAMFPAPAPAPAPGGSWPAVVFVHGGPIPAALEPTPRSWPVFAGYGNAVAARGAIGAVVDHRLYGIGDYPFAARDVFDAVAAVRADPRVDGDRIALWFFSGGGLLMGDWLLAAPVWLRCLAATYPVLGAPADADLDARFAPARALAVGCDVPIVLSRAGQERPSFAEMVAAFVTAAGEHGAMLQIIDVPGGQHGFDYLDHTDESRDAVERALDAVLGHLG